MLDPQQLAAQYSNPQDETVYKNKAVIPVLHYYRDLMVQRKNYSIKDAKNLFFPEDVLLKQLEFYNKVKGIHSVADQTMAIARSNIEDVLARGQKLEEVLQKTQDLAVNALSFKTAAVKLRDKYRCCGCFVSWWHTRKANTEAEAQSFLHAKQSASAADINDRQQRSYEERVASYQR